MWSVTRSASDKNCQATICEHDDFENQSTVRMCSDKNCQENEITNMWPVKLEMNVQLPKPAITRLCSDKNCQSTRCFQKKESSETNVWLWQELSICLI